MTAKKTTIAPAKPAAPAVVHPKVALLYLGSFITQKSEQAFRWCEMPAGWREKPPALDDKVKMRVYVKHPSTRPRAGNVYTFDYPEKDPSSLFLNTARYLGMFPVEAEVARLQALDDAARSQWELLRSEKRQKGRKIYLEVLEPLRLAYWSMGPTERGVLVSKVVRALTGRKALRAGKGGYDDE